MADWMVQPVVQYGFLGFSAVLIGIIVWLINQLLKLLGQTNQIIAANTDAICDLTAMTSDLLKLTRSLHDKIISRPCIARGESGVCRPDTGKVRS